MPCFTVSRNVSNCVVKVLVRVVMVLRLISLQNMPLFGLKRHFRRPIPTSASSTLPESCHHTGATCYYTVDTSGESISRHFISWPAFRKSCWFVIDRLRAGYERQFSQTPDAEEPRVDSRVDSPALAVPASRLYVIQIIEFTESNDSLTSGRLTELSDFCRCCCD